MKGDPASPRFAHPNDAPEERWVDAVRQQVRGVRAPESLRARIEAMLAVERRLGL